MLYKTIMTMTCLALVFGLYGCNAQDQTADGEAAQIVWYYQVKATENSFAEIAEKVYGDPQYAPLIAEANPTVEESALAVGDRLMIKSRTDTEGRVVEPRGCDRKKIY